MNTAYLMRALELVGAGAAAAAAVALFALAPGWLPGDAIVRRLGWGRAALVPVALTFSSAIAALATVPTFLLGGSLDAALVLYVGFALLFGWYGRRALKGRPAASGQREGLIVGAAAGLLALVQGPYMGQTADTFYHLAAVRSLLATGRAMVTDPMYGTVTGVLDPTSGVWHSMLAFWSRALDPAWLWAGLTAVAAAALALALWSLLRRVSGSDRAATIATTAWLVCALYLDLRTAAYPKLGSLAIVYVGIMALLELSEHRSRDALTLAVAAGLAASSVHLGSAELLYVFIAVLLVWLLADAVVSRARGGEWRLTAAGRVLGAGCLVGLAAVPVLLPKLGALAGSDSGGGLTGLRPTMGGLLLRWPGGLVSVQPGSLTGDGPVAFAFAAVLVLLMAAAVFGRARYRELLGGLAVASMPLLLLTDPLSASLLYKVSPYATERVAALLWFTPYVAVAWGLAQAGPETHKRMARWAAVAFVATALAFSWRLIGGTWARIDSGRAGARYPVPITRLADVRYQWGFDTLAKVRRTIGTSYPVVAGDPDTCYYLAGLAPVKVMAVAKSHSPYAIERVSGEERRADAARIMDPTTDNDTRLVILRRWDVEWVVLAPDQGTQGATLASMVGPSAVGGPHGGLFLEAVSGPTLVLLKVRPKDVP